MTVHARVLGIAQDAGVPHTGCGCPRCERYRDRPLLPACLGIVGEHGCYLIDATPALAEQLRILPALPEALLLTHLHMGHVGGLLQFGREALAASAMPLHATPSVCGFLETNGPWELMIRDGHLRPVPHAPGERFELEPGLEAEAIEVPHRNEYGDTVAFLVHGPNRRLLYLPDIDHWGIDPNELVARCDLALIDGTFYSFDELPRQDDVPHPPIEATLARLTAESLAKVRFIHFNHTNPVLDPDGPEVAVAMQGEEIEL